MPAKITEKCYYWLPGKSFPIITTLQENVSLCVTRHQVMTSHKIDQRHQYLHDKASLNSGEELRLPFLAS